MCKNKSEEARFHKNLFLDEIETSPGPYFSDFEDDYIGDDDEEYTDDDEYQSKCFKLNNLSLPLTDTIAEFVQDLSEDRFFLNDLSFVFEMSRKRAISPYAIIVALLYLKRLKAKTTQSKYTKSSSYWSCYSAKNLIDSYFKPKQTESETFTNAELCLVSILLASKFLIDEGEQDEIYNDQWAEVADVPVKKINQLERMFLKKMDWELFVSADEFWTFTNELTEKATRKKVKFQLGNCTYSDLDALISFSSQFSPESILKSVKLLLKIIFVCSSTLLYVTLSTYFVSTCVILIKNQLVNSNNQFNGLTKLSNTSISQPNEPIVLDNNYQRNYSTKSNGSSLRFQENKLHLDAVRSVPKLCNKSKISVNTTTEFWDDSAVKSKDMEYSKTYFMMNDILHQTIKLIF